ncbi:Alpha_amylase [Hexamita inflata]|uniref:Alpha amylase n=1 Tax=Hexamita inflata TaxID=28002 RepID=A0AA86P7X2_9EUKA|nr:Alpha amylase [Hexamita inflata]
MLATLVLSFPDPKSFRKQRIYQVITDRFAGGDECIDKREYCFGNLKSMAGKLDYIKNLGYTAIWISPTIEQAEDEEVQYQGYWPSDFYKTNPMQGSDQDLKDLVAEAHKRGLLVISDVNYNKVGQCYDGDVSCIQAKYTIICKWFFHQIKVLFTLKFLRYRTTTELQLQNYIFYSHISQKAITSFVIQIYQQIIVLFCFSL